jgi:hypothetical protein
LPEWAVDWIFTTCFDIFKANLKAIMKNFIRQSKTLFALAQAATQKGNANESVKIFLLNLNFNEYFTPKKVAKKMEFKNPYKADNLGISESYNNTLKKAEEFLKKKPKSKDWSGLFEMIQKNSPKGKN